MQAHVQTMEDRAHQQIDQVRQEAKALQQRLEREQREHGKRVTQFATQLEALQCALRTSEQATGKHTPSVA